MFKHLILASALLSGMVLASCSSDEPGIGGSENKEGSSVKFDNGTSLTISAPGAWGSRAGEEYDDANVNDACNYYIGEMPQVPAEAIDVVNPPEGFQPWTLGFGGSEATGWQPRYVDCKVPAGKEYAINGASINKDLFVEGKLIINSYYGDGNGRVIVLPGGSVDFVPGQMDKIHIVNYGTFNNIADSLNINSTASFQSVKDFNVNGMLNCGGNMYIDGNFTCQKFDPNNGALIHVTGKVTLTGEDNHFNNQAQVCFEGGMHAKHLEMNSDANFHIGCGLFIENELEMNNNMLLTTDYIQSPRTIISEATVRMPDKGLASLGNLTFGTNRARFEIAGNGHALIECDRCELMENFSLDQAIPADFYFNYKSFWVRGQGGWEQVTMPGITADGQHQVTIGTSLINLATANPYVPGQCNPSFTAPGDQPGDKVEENDNDDEIILHVPSDYDRDLYLEADDFALRVDGKYIPRIDFASNEATINGVSVSEKGFDVKVSGVQKLEAGKEYTYELYLWVKDTTWNAMTDEQKKQWVEGDGEGTDITNQCEMLVPKGFKVRKNVYRGLSGHADTPYIKVSIHVEKE